MRVLPLFPRAGKEAFGGSAQPTPRGETAFGRCKGDCRAVRGEVMRNGRGEWQEDRDGGVAGREGRGGEGEDGREGKSRGALYSTPPCHCFFSVVQTKQEADRVFFFFFSNQL